MKRAVASSEGAKAGVSAAGEKLVYKQKLRKYITNCNGESEPLAAWSTPGKSGLFKPRLPPPPRKQPSAFIMLYCYKEIAFLKVEPRRDRAAKGVSLTQLRCKLQRLIIGGSIASERYII